jgi:hypothetical protein
MIFFNLHKSIGTITILILLGWSIVCATNPGLTFTLGGTVRILKKNKEPLSQQNMLFTHAKDDVFGHNGCF